MQARCHTGLRFHTQTSDWRVESEAGIPERQTVGACGGAVQIEEAQEAQYQPHLKQPMCHVRLVNKKSNLNYVINSSSCKKQMRRNYNTSNKNNKLVSNFNNWIWKHLGILKAKIIILDSRSYTIFNQILFN